MHAQIDLGLVQCLLIVFQLHEVYERHVLPNHEVLEDVEVCNTLLAAWSSLSQAMKFLEEVRLGKQSV